MTVTANTEEHDALPIEVGVYEIRDCARPNGAHIEGHPVNGLRAFRRFGPSLFGLFLVAQIMGVLRVAYT